jgi:protein phosphatase
MESVEAGPLSEVRLRERRIEVAAATHAGGRRVNADAFLIDEAAGLFAVGDGMGDTPRSAAVARMVLGAVAELFLAPWSLLPPGERSADEARERLIHGLAQAQGRLYMPGRRPEERIGATFAGVVVCGGALCFAQVGDSRAYLLRRSKGQLAQIKEDDTVLGEALARGVPYAVAAGLPHAHAVTRMLGATSEVAPLPSARRWEPGDAVLLCTDGVSDRVEAEVLACFLLDAGDAGEAARGIVGRAVGAGGSDNATALVLRRTR